MATVSDVIGSSGDDGVWHGGKGARLNVARVLEVGFEWKRKRFVSSQLNVSHDDGNANALVRKITCDSPSRSIPPGLELRP